MRSSRSCMGDFTLLLIIIGVPLAIYYHNFHCRSHIDDSEDVFTIKQLCRLNNVLKKYEKNKGIKICVATFDYDGGYDKIKNCDVLIYCGKKVQKVGVKVIKSKLKSKLTDEIIQMIISNKMIPEFENNRFFDGVISGVYAGDFFT
jgi:uncharacterized membrane protein YgcG